MDVKLGAHLYLSVSMTTIDNKLPQALLLLHFSNLHTIQCMEVKLGTHMYFSVSMTTMNKKWPQALFPITTSSLLKLASHSGEICTQVYLSISMMSSSLRHSISIHTISIFIGACPPPNTLNVYKNEGDK